MILCVFFVSSMQLSETAFSKVNCGLCRFNWSLAMQLQVIDFMSTVVAHVDGITLPWATKPVILRMHNFPNL